MKIRCRECKTIYDNNEKYCPFCFTRTNGSSRSRVRVDGERYQKEKYKNIMDNTTTQCCSERKPVTRNLNRNTTQQTTRPVYQTKKHQQQQNQRGLSGILVLIFVIIEIIAFFF